MFSTDVVEDGGRVLGIIVSRDLEIPRGVAFLTPNSFPLQLGFLAHPTGHVVQPHFHPARVRVLEGTPEALFVLRGKVRVDFYRTDLSSLTSRTVSAGDVVLLVAGGHGLTVLEDAEIWEVKLGPYDPVLDKARFSPIPKTLPTPPEGFIDNA